MEGMECLRLPRFKRSPTVPQIRVTARDLEIIQLVHRHRFLRSSHIVQLIGQSEQQVLRRLQLLYHHTWLERPRAQIDYYHHGGSRRMVYGLGNKGAALLKRELKLPFHKLDWRPKNLAVTRLFLEHALLVNDMMVAIEMACRENGRVRFLSGSEMPLPEALRQERQPFKWNVTVANKSKLGVIPDGAFVLEFSDRPAGSNRILYFVEADSGAMPVTRGTLAQSSFNRKFLAYTASWTQDIHRSRFGFQRFRVLTVTSSAERVKSLVEACGQLERGQGLFLFTDHTTFSNHKGVLSLPWQSGRNGSIETLL
jgi:hypothetical protein